MAVGTSSGTGNKKKKKTSRETQYKRTKAAEAASRKKNTKSASTPTTTHYNKGKAKAVEEDDNPHPFRYKSFNDRLASVHINISNSLGRSGTGALSGLEGHGILPIAGSSSRMQVDGEEDDNDDDDIDSNEDEDGQASQLHAKTSFGIALLSWRELNLSLPFTLILQQIQPLSLSLPMLLYHQTSITRLLKQGLLASFRDSYLGYEPLLDLVPRLANDLGSSFLPSYSDLLAATLRITTISKLNTEGEEDIAAMLVERAFESTAATLRCVAPFVLREQKSVEGDEKDWLQITWQIVRPYLGRNESQESVVEVDVEINVDEGTEEDADEDTEQDNEEAAAAAVSTPIKSKKAKIPTHTRRFASEALAHLLRRAKENHLIRVAAVMMQDLREELKGDLIRAHLFASGIAGVWVEVAKSVDHRLHSSATLQLSALLFSNDGTTRDARICTGNYVITALVHYGQSAHLVPLFNWLADAIEERMQQQSESLDEIISWLIAFVGTRKGKRVDDSVKSRLFDILLRLVNVLDSLPSNDGSKMKSNIIQVIALSLPLGRIQDLVGPGKKIVDQLAALQGKGDTSAPFTAIATSLGQASFDFSSFRQIVLPAVMTLTMEILKGDDKVAKDSALCLLAILQQQGQFAHLSASAASVTTTTWLKGVSEEIDFRLSQWSNDLKEGRLGDISILGSLSLVSLFPSRAHRFVDILSQSISSLAILKEDTKSSFESNPLNQAGLLGFTISSLVPLLENNKADLSRATHQQISSNTDVVTIPLRFASYRSVITSYARLVKVLQDNSLILPLPSLEQLASPLRESLMSSDEPLRLSAARLLSMAEEQQKEANEESVLFRLVEIEETPLQVETIRERNVRMRAVAREIVRLNGIEKKPQLLETCASVVVQYLISVFKLNFRPLWEESKKALVDLSGIYGQEIWKAAFTELQDAQAIAHLPASWSVSLPDENTDSDVLLDNDGVDKQFCDPMLSERKQIISSCLNSEAAKPLLQGLIDLQRSRGRLDMINYHSLILGLFGNLSTLAERNNAPLMQHFFLTIVARNHEETGDDGDNQVHKGLTLTMFQRRAQLCAYLEMFAQFSNPKALYRSEDFHKYLYTLCSMGDNMIQGLALDVVLRWKDPSQVTYSSLLKKLTDPNTFREELIKLNLTQEGDTIQQSHRERLLPLLIRLFFGIMVSKRGRASQGSGQMGRKNAILVALSELPAHELKPLVDIMLEPFKDQRNNSSEFFFTTNPPLASHGRQSGFLSLLGDVIKHLGLQLIPLWDQLIVVTLNLTLHASVRALEGQGKATAIYRNIRQTGMRRIDDFFKQPTAEFNWNPFLAPLFERLISPRLSSLRIESIQSPSALLDLIHTWSNGSVTVFYLVDYDSTLLEHVISCLTMSSVKPTVIAKILDMIEAMLSYVDARTQQPALADEVQAKLLRPGISVLLSGLTPLVHRCNATTGMEAKALKKDDLLRRLLHILKGLSPYIATASDASTLLEAVSPMLRKNNAIIAEKSKVDLLLVYERLLALVPEMQDPHSAAFASQYKLFSGLFSRLRSRSARLALCQAFINFSITDASLKRVNEWMLDLNSYDPKRMEEYDFEKRLKVFDTVNEGLVESPITIKEWLPLLHNFLFNVQDIEELAIRANAGSAVRKFIDLVASAVEEDSRKQLTSLFIDVVYPGLRRGLRSKSDLVQREVVSILGHAVSHLSDSLIVLKEMKGLLVSGDEEASFFNNIYHIQVHRRVRALNRLGQEAESGVFSSRLIVEIFLPLVDQFLNTETHHGDANLVNAAVECLGRLSMHLKWGPYNVLLWKFLSIGKKTKDGEKEKEKEKSDKVCVRAAMSILDHFHFNMEEETVTLDENEAGDGEEEIGEEELAVVAERAEAVIEETKKVLGAVQNRLLPKLMDFLDQKDDLEDTVRLPIAVGMARVILKLPQPLRRIEMNKLLATLANVFKSKAQDTRDLARTTLGKVAISLGPEYLSAIVRELRRALTRGPQKAVLAYTVHNILIQCISNQDRPLIKLDIATANIVDVVMEDVFGQTSEDRDSIENRTTYKEVKSTKSLDTLEHVAKIVDSSYVATLLTPLRDLMHQTEAVKAVKSMDDCLRRISAGLNGNDHISSGEFILLCHSLLTSNADFLQASRQQAIKSKKAKMGFAAVLRKRSEVEGNSNQDHYARNAHKFVAFGMDLLIHGLRRGKFDYSDSNILARLNPMINAVGNCLYVKQGVVIVAGLRALSMLVKCPVQSVQTSMPLIIKQTLKIVEKEGANAQSDILMASLKLLTVVIRDTSSTRLQDRQVTQLIQLIDVNLDEDAELQGVLFGLLRAIVGGKYVMAEVYDVMDKVASMMVTNQSASIRDVCRSTYLTFLLEFPQGQARFSNQMTFLSKNINYIFESGRLSLLEFLRVIFIKMQEEALRDHLNLFFISLVMCLGNDESSKCKEKASKLIIQIMEVCREQEREKLVDLTHLWAQSGQGEKKDLARIAMIVYGLFCETPLLKEDEAWKGKALSNAKRILAISADDLERQEYGGDGFDSLNLTQDWQLSYQALQVVSKLYTGRKASEMENDAEIWQAIRNLLLFPHTWVRTISCRLIGQRLGQMEVQKPKGVEAQFGSMTNLLKLTKKMSLMLKSDLLDDALALQIVKNLVYIGKCFALVTVASRKEQFEQNGSDEEIEEEDGDTTHDWSMENPLRWMFTKLSHQLRQCKLSSASIEPLSQLQPSTLLKWFAAMVNHLSIDQSQLFLTHIISPLYRILEAESHLSRNTQDDNFISLQSLATQVQDLIQSKVGTNIYSLTYSSIKQKAVEKRKKRKDEALMMAIQQPEKAMKRKAAVNQRKHESRKRKTQSYIANKERMRPMKG